MSSSTTPHSLAEIPEIQEIDQILMRGIGPRDIIEATLPPLPPTVRAVLRSYLKKIEAGSNLLTELLVFDDMELILITEIPIDLVTKVSARA